jgi:hypothetical protein
MVQALGMIPMDFGAVRVSVLIGLVCEMFKLSGILALFGSASF